MMKISSNMTNLMQEAPNLVVILKATKVWTNPIRMMTNLLRQ
jgi:hypothetical protein